ncbi:MAG: major capsid protein [Desulfotomaculum sp.]|nr:major capsid protein [Desulfotomaculum sp.]
MGIDNIYETRTMLQAIEMMMPVRTFFRDTFFPTVITFPTEKIDVDFKKGKRKMAPFVARNRGGITIDRQGFRTDTYETPYIAPQRVLTKNDISSRMLGERIYSRRTPEQRAQELLAKDLAELDEMITRREEWLCRELLLNGMVTIKGWVDKVGGTEYVEDTIDYNFTNKETLSGTDMWTDAASDKYGDLKRIRLQIIQKSGINPNLVIMANNVADMFINDDKIQKLLDIRNLTIGQVQPSIRMDGVTYLGTLTSLGLELYTYDEWFLDDDGNEYPMMPENHLIMGRANLGARLYGAVTQVEESDKEFHTYEGARIPKVWTDTNNDQKMIRVASRPLPKPEDVDSWYVLKVA